MADGVATSTDLNDLERSVIAFCCDGVRVLGLPKSVGEIYGLLYISPDPQSLHDLVTRLGISKGSASQGLRFLRTLGAVVEVSGPDERRTYFKADTNLKQLVGGFIREEIRPHLQSGDTKLEALADAAALEGDEELREFYERRVSRLKHWTKQARLILPLVQRVLGE